MNTVADSTLPVFHDAAAQPTAWRDLFAWERRRVASSRVFWCVAALVLAAFCAGSIAGGSLQRAQAAAQHAQAADDAAWMREVARRAHDYARPAAEPAPYWQDPTDVAGFSRYQLRQHAWKPVLPLAALSVGASDLAPSRWPVKLDTPFGVEPVYDFEPPRGLAIGRFDLGFAIVAVLPVAIIALAGLVGTVERDRGMLRLIASLPVTPLAWLSARVAALAAWLLPVLAVALTLALVAGGADLAAAWREWLAALALLTAYALFWLALAFAVLATWPGAAAAIGSLLTLWLVVSLALPMLGRFVADIALPAPSRVLYVDAQRRTDDAIAAARDTLVTDAFHARADLAPYADRAANIDYATRQTLLVPITEARMAPWHERIAANREARETLSTAAGWFAPPLGLEASLATLAGTDTARQRVYEQAVRAYQQRLRDFFWPRVQREIVQPTSRPAGSYARLNFTGYAAIPAFAPSAESAAARVRAVLPFAAWLTALAAVLTWIAARRLRTWPKEL